MPDASSRASDTNNRRRITPLSPLASNSARHFLASAFAGAAGVTALAPLEVIRIHMMMDSKQSLGSAMRALGGFKRGGWFRGNTADTLAAALKVGVTMPAYAVYKEWLTAAARRWGDLDDDAPAPRWSIFFAGALAGCTATLIAFPLDVARTRLAMQCDLDLSVGACLFAIGEKEGFKALYQGLSATVAGILPFSSMKLATYDLLRRQVTAGVDDVAASISLGMSASIGAAAGVVAATSCFPLEVVRRRQMMGEFSSLSVAGAMSAIARAEGMKALFAGVGLNIAKTGMANALGFALYEISKDLLEVDGRTPPWRKQKLALCE